jgi:hypothetical protein
VKELQLYKTTFSLLPTPGLTIENAEKVSIIDCVFNKTYPGSIHVDNVKEVEIVNNQFSINTIEVIKTTKSPNLYISCNRLLGEAVSMECATISSALHTDSSTSVLPESSMSSISSADLDIKSEKQVTTNVSILLWVMIVAGLVFLTVVLLCVCWRGRQSKEDGDEEKNALKNYDNEVMLTPNLSDNKNKRFSTDADIVVESNNDVEDIIEKVKEQEAILQTELQELTVNS